MKTLLITLSLMATLGTQAHASDPAGFSAKYLSPITLSPFLPTALTSVTSTANSESHKEAQLVLKEGHEYLQSGEMGILIAKKVEELQEDQDMSDNEAVDALMSMASDILNN